MRKAAEVLLFLADKLVYGPRGMREDLIVQRTNDMKRNFLMGAAMLASLATLSACGGKKEEAPAPAATEAAAPAATEAAAPAADAGAKVEYASFTTDAAAGEKVFALCRSCHVLEDGVNRVGPSLYNVVGRASGQVAGFAYSDANKNSGVTWSEDVLFEYLKDPKAFMPGTKMAFPGIKDDQDRANLVAYLASTKK